MTDAAKFPLYPDTASIAFLKKDTASYRVFPMIDPRQRDVFQPNILSIYKIATNTGYESLKPENISEFAVYPLNTQLLGMTGVKYLITHRHADLNLDGLSLVYDRDVRIYRNSFWKPRVFMAYRFQVETHDIRGGNNIEFASDFFFHVHEDHLRSSGFLIKKDIMY